MFMTKIASRLSEAVQESSVQRVVCLCVCVDGSTKCKYSHVFLDFNSWICKIMRVMVRSETCPCSAATQLLERYVALAVRTFSGPARLPFLVIAHVV